MTYKCLFVFPKRDHNIKNLTVPSAPQVLFEGAFGGVNVLRNTRISAAAGLMFSHICLKLPQQMCLICIQKEDFFFFFWPPIGMVVWPYNHTLRRELASKPESVFVAGDSVNLLLCLSFFHLPCFSPWVCVLYLASRVWITGLTLSLLYSVCFTLIYHPKLA